MLSKLFQKIDQNQIVIKIERAINDLRKGLPVILDNNYLVFASETIEEEFLHNLDSCHKTLIVTKNRANTIGIKTNKNIGIKIDILSLKYIENLCLEANYRTSNTEFDHQTIYDNIVNLMNLSELLPSAIIVKDIPFNTNLIHIKSEEIEQYSKDANKNYNEICTAKIDLPYAKNVKFTAFRPIIGGKEHYAIIIGKPESVGSPLVRIHSSCYTGDLLQSLSCDCYEQLKNCIELIYSSPEKAGIIVYLMQEGRGIGLTNKLRTQSLQENGHDIVDSSVFLGFGDDERSYVVASKILEKLHVKKLRLLTNNPNKVRALEECGVKVDGIIPLISEKTKNSAFFKVKVEKLGHLDK